MVASLIAIAREETRMAATGDERYHTIKPYAFVLRCPGGYGSLGPSGEAVFPLPINPTSFDYNLPFAAQVTLLQDGGVVADEQGFVTGEILIEATTGFKLRKPLDTSYSNAVGLFTGDLDPGNWATPNMELSGQMMFWRLANRCFEGYSNLKKDPKTASKTTMEFHSMKDALHLTVIPREFRLIRNASQDRVTYRFSVRLTAVGPASANIVIPSPDTSLLQSMKNTISNIRSAVQGVRAAIDDITAAIDEVRRNAVGIAGVLDDVGSVLNACDDFLNGVKSFIDIPSAFIQSTGALVDSMSDHLATISSFPADVAQSMLNISDEINRIQVASRDHFKSSMDEVARKYEKLTDGRRSSTDKIRANQETTIATLASISLGKLTVNQAFGQVKPGDAVRNQIAPNKTKSRLRPGEWRGFEERIVGQGDTIQSLAAKYMGDANDWILIAVANQLQSPYITNGAKLPGTLQPGSKFIIPISDTASVPNVFSTGEVALGKSQAEAYMGTDFELVRLANGTYGWQIDAAGGSTDVHKVSGVNNLGQSFEGRMRTEQGTNILYPNLGMPRMVGVKNFGEKLVDARYEVRRQLMSDSRVEQLAGIKFTVVGDAVDIDIDVVPVGFTTVRTISRTLT